MPISAALGSSALLPAGLGFRNKIINGDMRINQRNSGTLTGSGSRQFPVDQWGVWNGTGTVTFQQSTTAPSGFSNSFLATVTGTGSYGTGGYTQVQTKVEGFNCQDLAFGTTSAKPIVLSFWCRSSIVGTYPVQLRNSAADRSYVALFAINSANTWEQKVLTITGDTSGTWLTNNGVGLDIILNLGIGTDYDTASPNSWISGNKGSTSSCVDFAANAGATFYITGVQLEQNYQATPFEQRPYGVELALCQRYYWRSTPGLTTDAQARHAHFRRMNQYPVIASGHCAFPVAMRTEPTVGLYNGNGLGAVDGYGVGQESYVVASGEGLSPYGIGLFVKYTNSSLTTTANFNVDATSVTYWANIEASAEL